LLIDLSLRLRGTPRRNQADIVASIRVDHHKHATQEIRAHRHETLLAGDVLLSYGQRPVVLEHAYSVGKTHAVFL
jgi:hypothetical protein